MKNLLLGGYGQFALPTARQMAHNDLTEEIIIAGHNLGTPSLLHGAPGLALHA